MNNNLNDSKKILHNLFSLTAAELFSKGLQFYLAFYLMATLGVENYGIWAFSKAHIMFYLVVVMLGFNTVATREIAKDESLIPKYVNNIQAIRLIFSVASYLLLLIIVFTTLEGEKLKQIVVIISGIKIITDGLLMNWVFDGIQKMHISAIRSIVTSIVSTLGIVLLVKEPDDIILAAWIVALAFAVNTIWIMIYYSKKFTKIKLELDFIFIKNMFKSALPIGIAYFIINLYNSLDSQMLEYMFDDINLSNYFNGVYGAAHQVLLAAMIPSGILQGAYFPQFSQKHQNPDEFNNMMNKFTKMTFGIGIFMGIMIALYSDDLVHLLLESEYFETGRVLQLLSVTIIITYINITFFIPLIAAGLERQVLWANLTGLIFNAIFNFILIPEYNVFGAAIATIASELGVLLFLLYLFKKRFTNLHFKNLGIMFAVSILGSLPFLINFIYETNFLILFTLSILFFIIFNFIFRTISIKEIKGILKK